MSKRIIAFYGFKGGAGRSFLLSNTAALLAAAGCKVLVIDADLEAPGVGDFFDTPGGTLASDWRLREGFIDLVAVLSRNLLHSADPDAAGVKELIGALFNEPMTRAGLSGRRFISGVTIPYEKGPGSLHLMGPGSHELSPEEGSFSYVLKTLQLDWHTLAQSTTGQLLLGGLKSYLFDSEYTHVLIDGRTGYNTASLIAIRHLATDVVMVGTESLQSIDGVARMRPLFVGPDGEPDLTTHLVFTKSSGATPDPAHKALREMEKKTKDELNQLYYHPGQESWEFPFIEDLVSGDSLIFRRGGLNPNKQTAGSSGLNPNARNYLAELVRFTVKVTGEQVSDEHLGKTFEAWGGSNVSSEFNKAIAVSGEAFAAASDARKESCKAAIREYLKSGLKASDRKPGEERQENQRARTIDAFKALTAEERALITAWTAKHLEEDNPDPSAVKSLSNIIPLAILPNVTSLPQLNALQLTDRAESLQSARQSSTPANDKANKKGPTVREREAVRQLCSEVVRGKTNIEADAEEPHSTMYDQTRHALTLVAGRAEWGASTPSKLRELAELVGNHRLLLPALHELPRANVLDVLRLAADPAAPQDVVWSEAATELCRTVVRFLSQLARTDALSDPRAALQLAIDIPAWLRLWTGAAMQGYQAAAGTPNYPHRDELEPLLRIVSEIAEADFSGATRISALVARFWLQLESGDHEAAKETFRTGLLLARRFKPSDDPQCQEALGALRDVARELYQVRDSWELDRRSKSFASRGSTSPTSFYTAAATWAAFLELDFNVATLSEPADKSSEEWKYYKTITWWGETSVLQAGQLAKFIQMSEREDAPGPLRGWLVMAYARLNQVEQAVQSFRSATVSPTATTRSDFYNSVLATSSDILYCYLMTGKLKEFDAFWLESSQYLVHANARTLNPGHWGVRTILECQRVSASSSSFSGDSGPYVTDNVAARAQGALETVIATLARNPHPTDSDFDKILGAKWDGLGVFTGTEYPCVRRASLANLLINVLGLQRTWTKAIEPRYLAMAERLLWGTGGRDSNGSLATADVGFLNPIRLALCAARARLEYLRSELGLAADLATAAAEMAADIAANGPSRSAFYPRSLRDAARA